MKLHLGHIKNLAADSQNGGNVIESDKELQPVFQGKMPSMLRWHVATKAMDTK